VGVTSGCGLFLLRLASLPAMHALMRWGMAAACSRAAACAACAVPNPRESIMRIGTRPRFWLLSLPIPKKIPPYGFTWL
jgi:hypothetical protein